MNISRQLLSLLECDENSIMYIEKIRTESCSQVVVVSGKCKLITGALTQVPHRLSLPSQYVQAHKGIVVNLTFCEMKGNSLWIGNKEIPIARRRRTIIKNQCFGGL